MKREDGFTLLEIIITLTIMSLVLGAIYTLMLNGISAWKRQETQIDTLQNMRVAMNLLSKEIENGSNLQVIQTTNPPRSQLQSGQSGTIKFYLENGIIYRESNGAKNPLAYGIDSLVFEELGNNLVGIEISAMVGNRKYRTYSRVWQRVR